MLPKKRYILFLQLLVPVLLALLAYSNTFHVPFQFDDAINISINPVIKDFSYFLSPHKAEGLKQYNTLHSRYIGYLSFALDFQLHGLHVTGYHVVNLLIHAINILLVFAFVMLVFRTPVLRQSALREHARWIAFLSAVLFAVHPVQTQAVTYIVQRFASLAALFYLGTMVCYLLARLAARKSGRYTFHTMAFVLCVFAMYTKQTAFTLPLAVMLLELLFFSGPWRKRVPALIPLLLTMAIVPFNAMNYNVGVAGATNVLDIPKGQYLLTEFRVLVTYLRLFMLPLGQNFDYDYPLSSTLFSAPVIFSVLLLLMFFGLGVFMYRLSRQEDPAWRLASFGVLMFFLALSVESTFIPLRPMNEHRLYLPSIGIFILLGACGVIFFRKLSGGRRKAFVLLIVSVCAVLSLLTYERNNVWRTKISLWSDVVEKAPYNARAYLNLGSTYYDTGFKKEAEMAYERSLSLFAPFVAQYRSLSRSEHLKRLQAMGIYTRNAKAYAELHYDMGLLAASEGRYEDAVKHFRTADQVTPGYVDALFNLAIHSFNMGHTADARDALTEALRYEPNNKVVRKLLEVINSESKESH